MTRPDSSDPLIAAFPAELAGDVKAVLSVMPVSRHGPPAPFSVVVQGQQVSIPRRLYNDEPPAEVVASLSSRQRQLLHCLYSRHCDGMVRQHHLEKVVGSADPWVIPFVVQPVGEYVLEILVVIYDELRDLGTPGARDHVAYRQFIVDNPNFFARTQRRVVSYWSCYYRSAHSSFRDYPGCALLELLRSAASRTAGRPWPDLTPIVLGHSYGGSVISGVRGAGHPVYLAAFVPDAGESAAGLGGATVPNLSLPGRLTSC